MNTAQLINDRNHLYTLWTLYHGASPYILEEHCHPFQDKFLYTVVCQLPNGKKQLVTGWGELEGARKDALHALNQLLSDLVWSEKTDRYQHLKMEFVGSE